MKRGQRRRRPAGDEDGGIGERGGAGRTGENAVATAAAIGKRRGGGA